MLARVKKNLTCEYLPALTPPPSLPSYTVYDSINVTLITSILKNVMQLCNEICFQRGPREPPPPPRPSSFPCIYGLSTSVKIVTIVHYTKEFNIHMISQFCSILVYHLSDSRTNYVGSAYACTAYLDEINYEWPFHISCFYTIPGINRYFQYHISA